MKKLKAFIPYAIGSTALYDWCGKAAKSSKTLDVLTDFLASDPGATDWSDMGLSPICIEPNHPVHDLDGTARMMVFQFSERVLPASVRDEALKKEFARIQEKQGRALNKKEYAQIKEDVEFALLPKAFIKRTLVPVMVFPHHLFVFTTSAKKCESVVTFISRMAIARKVEFDIHGFDTKVSIEHWLTQMVMDGHTADPADFNFHTLDAAVFKGADKRAIRVKGRDLAHKEVQEILHDESYEVTELAMGFLDESDGLDALTFTLTDRFTFKGIKLSDVTMTRVQGDAADKHATSWLIASTYKQLFTQVLMRLNEDTDDEADEEL